MLTPLSLLYPWGAFFHRSLYRCGAFDTQTLPKPVLSVGNITSGGTGKTPLVIKLTEDLRNAGHKPAVLIRGYKRSVSGEEPLVLMNGDHPVTEAGDEAFLISQRLPQVPVVISPDRTKAGRLAIEAKQADCLILDDGFQYWPLTRNVDIVCLDAQAPFGGGWSRPCCFLREWPSALRRARLIVITKADLADPEKIADLKKELGRLCPRVPVAECIYEAALTVPEGQAVPENLSSQKVLALSGIGSPQSFEKMLSRLGTVDILPARFPDHHAFTLKELEPLFEKAGRESRLVVTTEKDAVRLPLPNPVYILSIKARLISGEEHWRSVIQKPWLS